jgi:hypothetical protein
MPSYDPTTLIGETRLYYQDTDYTNLVFQDAEVQVFLNRSNGSPMLAAALALDTMANNAAANADIIKLGSFSDNSMVTAEALRQRAIDLRALCILPPSINAPVPVFTNDTSLDSGDGTMDGW